MLYQLSYTPAGGLASRAPGRGWQGLILPVARRKCYAAPVHAPVTPHPLDPELLLLAYRGGIFPMADSRDDPDVFWVEPRQRAILPLDGFILSHSLARTLRRGRFSVTCNQAFAEVMDGCAAPRNIGRSDGSSETWISHRIAASYVALHDEGHAHSLECWQDGQLVGGLYGVGFDRVFCGESMFSRTADASKVALAWLVAALQHGRVELLDCQFMTSHLASLGAVEISQQDYLARLSDAQRSAGLGAGDGVGEAEAEGFGAGAALALPDGFAAVLAAAAGSSSSPGNFIAQSLTHTS